MRFFVSVGNMSLFIFAMKYTSNEELGINGNIPDVYVYIDVFHDCFSSNPVSDIRLSDL
jgi:hypothetical protein